MIEVALEPCSPHFSLAISKGTQVWNFRSPQVHLHSELLLMKLKEGLELFGSLQEVTKWIVTIGPGSFTGTRIALASLKGIFYGLENIGELYTLTSFQAGACAKGNGLYTVGVEVKKGTLCYQDFKDWELVGSPYFDLPRYEMTSGLDAEAILKSYSHFCPKPLSREEIFLLEPIYVTDSFEKTKPQFLK